MLSFWTISEFSCLLFVCRVVCHSLWISQFISSDHSLARYYVNGPKEYGDFVAFVSKLLSDRGVFVARIGEAPFLDWPTAENSVIQNRFKFVQSLLGAGFTSVVDYEEVCFVCV